MAYRVVVTPAMGASAYLVVGRRNRKVYNPFGGNVLENPDAFKPFQTNDKRRAEDLAQMMTNGVSEAHVTEWWLKSLVDFQKDDRERLPRISGDISTIYTVIGAQVEAPRISGDIPKVGGLNTGSAQAPPHKRGYTRRARRTPHGVRGSPAYAGIYLRTRFMIRIYGLV